MQTSNSSPHMGIASLENDNTSQQIALSPLETDYSPSKADFSPSEMNFSSSKADFSPSKVEFSPLEISLKDLHFYAYHGVLPQERVVGGRFTVQIHLMVQPSLEAIFHDNLEGTVSYAEVYALAKEVMAHPSQLLEHVAARMLQTILAYFPQVVRATVEVQKDNPPMGAALSGCSVRLSASRAEAPV